MRITNNMVTSGILGELQQLETQQSSLQTEVSSGLSVTQPADNPAVFGQVVQQQAQSSQLTQYIANSNQALNLSNASYGGLNSMVSIYDRASQLATLGGSTLGNSATTAYASELDQLIQQTVQVANTQYGGSYLYAGTKVDTPPFTTTTDPVSGQITAATYVGNATQTQIALSSTANVAPGTSGATNSGIADFINNMIALRDALQAGNQTSVTTAAGNLSGSEDLLTTAVADNGAVQARIQADQTQETAEQTQVSSLISSETDADLPTTIVKLNQAQLAYQAALQSAASVMHISLLNYVNLQ